jgi:hypothetical protein
VTPYFITFALLTLAALTQFTSELKRYKLWFVLVAAIYLILFAGLRTIGVGRDDLNYYDMFMAQAPNLYDWMFGGFVYHFSDLYMEPGYVFVNAVVKTFTNNYTFLFLTAALISIGVTIYNYYRYSTYVLLSILLYFVHTYLYRDMNQVRAGIAAAIGLFLIAEINNREHIKSYRTLLLSGLFHIASLSLVIPYLLSCFRTTRKKIILLYAISLSLGIIGIGRILVKLLPSSGFIFVKIADYASDRSYGAALKLYDPTNVKNFIVLLIVLIYWKRLKAIIPYFETLVLFLAVSASWRLAFSDLGIIAGRVATFFDIVEVIVIPYFVCISRYKWMTVSAIILYAFMTLYLNLYTVKISPQPYSLSLF